MGVYVRVSADEQAKHGYSVRHQFDVLQNVITNSGIGGVHNVRFYVDDGESGTTMDRPNFQRLLSDIKKGNVNLVMATDSERIGRENEYNSFWIKYLKAYNCEFYLHVFIVPILV
ncbi:recombinase family protein [Erysipelothrix larvae]|uniref:recombinase family protein n=1 Tax=Erysipelothrix larvae TaxID=1514105 RepID=UPI001E4E3531|nr:recombinase family protein [Erysipelothrix larvae]